MHWTSAYWPICKYFAISKRVRKENPKIFKMEKKRENEMSRRRGRGTKAARRWRRSKRHSTIERFSLNPMGDASLDCGIYWLVKLSKITYISLHASHHLVYIDSPRLYNGALFKAKETAVDNQSKPTQENYQISIDFNIVKLWYRIIFTMTESLRSKGRQVRSSLSLSFWITDKQYGYSSHRQRNFLHWNQLFVERINDIASNKLIHL